MEIEGLKGPGLEVPEGDDPPRMATMDTAPPPDERMGEADAPPSEQGCQVLASLSAGEGPLPGPEGHRVGVAISVGDDALQGDHAVAPTTSSNALPEVGLATMPDPLCTGDEGEEAGSGSGMPGDERKESVAPAAPVAMPAPPTTPAPKKGTSKGGPKGSTPGAACTIRLDASGRRLQLRQAKFALTSHPATIGLLSRHYQLLAAASSLSTVPGATGAVASSGGGGNAGEATESEVPAPAQVSPPYTLSPEHLGILHPLIALYAQESGMEERRLVSHIQGVLLPKDGSSRPTAVQEALEAEIKRAVPLLAERVNYGTAESGTLALRRWEVREVHAATLFPPELAGAICRRREERAKAKALALVQLPAPQSGVGQAASFPGDGTGLPGAPAEVTATSPMQDVQDEGADEADGEKENDAPPAHPFTTPAKLKAGTAKSSLHATPAQSSPGSPTPHMAVHEQLSEEVLLVGVGMSASKSAGKGTKTPLGAAAEKRHAKSATKRGRKLESGQKSLFGFFTKKAPPPVDARPPPPLPGMGGELGLADADSMRATYKDYYATFLPFVVKERMTVTSLPSLTQGRGRCDLTPSALVNCHLVSGEEATEAQRLQVLATLKTNHPAPPTARRRRKFVFFHTDVRPPFVGLLLPHLIPRPRAYRNPGARLPELDYSVDSELEWEEDAASLGEELLSDDDQRSADDGEGDSDDAFLVPHGYLSEDEGDGERVVLHGTAAAVTPLPGRSSVGTLPPSIFNNLVERATTPHDILLFHGLIQVRLGDVLGRTEPKRAPPVKGTALPGGGGDAKAEQDATADLATGPVPAGVLPSSARKAHTPRSIPAEILPAIRALVLQPDCAPLTRVQLVQRVVDSFPANNLTKISVDAYLRPRAKRVGPHNGKRWILLEEPVEGLAAPAAPDGGGAGAGGEGMVGVAQEAALPTM